jgi:hypothetical protein
MSTTATEPIEGVRPELPLEIADCIGRWMGSRKYVYFWENEGTYYVVVKHDLLYFLRLFKMGGEYVISQDYETELEGL